MKEFEIVAETCPNVFCDPAWQESPWEKQLRLALDRLEIAQNGLKTAKTKEEVEAAKKEVEAAEKKVEAAEKKVAAGPAQSPTKPTAAYHFLAEATTSAGA